MDIAIEFNGIPRKSALSYHVPDDIITQYSLPFDTEIIPIVEIKSLKKYVETTFVGGYYASRSELAYRFYKDNKERTSLIEGALPSLCVPYKKEGVVEFVFDRFSLSWDKNTLYAIYVYGSTIS